MLKISAINNRAMLLLLVLLLMPLQVLAQVSEVPLLPTFFEQHLLSDDVDEGIYVISGLNENSNECFLQSIQAKNKTKLCAVSLSKPGNKIEVTDANLLWQIKRKNSDKLVLYSPTTHTYLTRKKANTVDLILNTNETSMAEWSYKIKADGRLFLYDGNRTLVPHKDYNVDEDVSYFGNYSTYYELETDLKGLALYQVANVQVSGKIAFPTDGQRVCLASSSTLRMQNGGEAFIDDALLSNGSVAPIDGLQLLTVELSSAATFRLCCEGGYLSYDLTPSSTPCEWQVKEGCLCTVETEPRFVAYTSNHWGLCSADVLKTPTQWLQVAPTAQQAVNSKGVCFLSGGWSAEALQNLLLTDAVRCIDMTTLSLPVKQFAFTSTVNKNIPIFIDEATSVPTTWRFVVRCCAAGNRLLDASLHMVDKAVFSTDRPFSVADGQITYERSEQTEKGWETLSLPFKAKVVGEAKLYDFERFSNDTLLCNEVKQTVEGKGYLVYREAAQKLVLTSVAGEVRVPTEVEQAALWLQPTMQPLQVDNSQTLRATYLLQRSSSSFRLAATGSKLAPFRAYLQMNEKKKALHFKIK